MAHHVVQHTAALQLAAPEPWHVRAAVLFGCAREIGTSGRRRAARPEKCASRLHLRRKDLILEIAVRDARTRDEIANLLRLGDVARQRLLAGDAAELALAALDRVHDLFDVLDARVIRT